MIKKIALLLALTIATAYTTNVSLAAGKQRSISVNPTVYGAISKYKQHNYTGVIQDLKPYLDTEGDKYKDKNNTVKDSSIAYYYYGLAYSQLGMKEQARAAYDEVLQRKDDLKLVNYTTRAVACLEGRPECAANYVDKNAPLDDMTVFIQSGKPLHDDVVEQIQKKSLDKQMDRINNDMAPDSQNYKYLNDASDAVKAQPTDAEIANAVRILAKVGFNPLNNMMNGYSDPQMAAMSAMLGNSNNNNNMNYLPYMLSQGSANPDAAKQMIQNMMMSQMMF